MLKRELARSLRPYRLCTGADNVNMNTQPPNQQTDRQSPDKTNDPPITELLWQHSDPTATRMFGFKALIQDKYHQKLETYEHLRQWSTTNLTAFWEEVWHFTHIRASTPFTKVNRDPAKDCG